MKVDTSERAIIHELEQSASQLRNGLRNKLRPLNLSMHQYLVLACFIELSGGLSIGQMVELMPQRYSDTSRVVERLVRKRLLTKRRSKVDGRKTCVELTREGALIVRRIERWKESRTERFTSLKEKEKVELIRLLRKARE